MKTPTATLIRAYLRAELEKLAKLGRGPFTRAEIAAELARRDEIAEKRQDSRIYPELSASFR